MITNPFGRSFLSYRRSAAKDARALILAQNTRGIPTWRDVDDLEGGPTGDALIVELESPDTANAILWVTPDVIDSAAIKDVEAPRIIRRARAADSFFVEAVLSGGLLWGEVSAVFNATPTVEDLSKGWNLKRARSPLSTAAARGVANDVLRRRLEAIVQHTRDEPLRLVLHTRRDAPFPFDPAVALQLDWRAHFRGRTAKERTWNKHLLPALADVAAGLQRAAPTRVVEAAGLCCLPAALALGRAFMEPSRLRLTWTQHTPQGGQRWSLLEASEDSGFSARTQHTSFDGADLGVFVSVRNDVEPAVADSDTPSFGAVCRISPSGGEYPANIESPGQAVHLARLVVREMRAAFTAHPKLRCAHLFLSGPVGLAVLIGQQLNALGPVQTYEHMPTGGPGRYEPAARLVDQLTEQAT